MKNKLFSALFLSIITTLAACGDNIPAEEPAAESTATPAVVSAAPAPVQVVATKCFDIGSDGILHVTGKVRFDGPVGINADPVDGTGLTSQGETMGVHGNATAFAGTGVSGTGSYGVQGSGGEIGVVGAGTNYGMTASGGTTGISAYGDTYAVYANARTTSTYSVYGLGGIMPNDDRVKNLESEVAQLKTLVQQLLAAQQPQ